jgi:hypothetical protein
MTTETLNWSAGGEQAMQEIDPPASNAFSRVQEHLLWQQSASGRVAGVAAAASHPRLGRRNVKPIDPDPLGLALLTRDCSKRSAAPSPFGRVRLPRSCEHGDARRTYASIAAIPSARCHAVPARTLSVAPAT